MEFMGEIRKAIAEGTFSDLRETYAARLSKNDDCPPAAGEKE